MPRGRKHSINTWHRTTKATAQKMITERGLTMMPSGKSHLKLYIAADRRALVKNNIIYDHWWMRDPQKVYRIDPPHPIMVEALPVKPQHTATNERVHFRLIVCPECHHNLCWVNPRLPNHCPECGKHIYPAVRSAIHLSDDNATLRYTT